ncbi:MAG: hypothetical protein ISQ88_07890 [Rhodobacteraceae bacterium]|nr:hypothetical protein [Paracoccaceae bacterium]|tara:strand:- start:194 stop:373 length:180 start_codon:yes stop_codon:yes gene_type:complete
MTDFEMEEIYESLARKIDKFEKEKSDIFLSKLVLLLSKKFTDLDEVLNYIEEASLDLKN